MAVANHSSRSWFAGVFGNTLPELRSASVPYFWSFLHIRTLSLVLFAGRLKISSSQATGSRCDVIFITCKCYSVCVEFENLWASAHRRPDAVAHERFCVQSRFLERRR